jgi:hypothetical protein
VAIGLAAALAASGLGLRYYFPMPLDVATYAGFKAFVSEMDDGIEVRYCDAEGREIDREVFAGVKDHRLKQEHIDAQLKKFWVVAQGSVTRN